MAKTIYIVDASTGKIGEYRILDETVTQWAFIFHGRKKWANKDGTEHAVVFAFEDVEKAKIKANSLLNHVIEHHWGKYNTAKRIQRENEHHFGYLRTE